MDIKDFYFQNINETEYHYRFYDVIVNINKHYNVFDGVVETGEYEFVIFDTEEAITKFKELCQPEMNFLNNEKKCWFYLLTYYLHKMGYVIKEFPRILARPPVNPEKFTCDDIRRKIISLKEDDNGIVHYATRREYVENLSFEIRDNYIELPEAIEQKFLEISNRQSTFNNMSTNEKLTEIVNLIENMLKNNGKYKELDYSKICYDYITDKSISSYKKRIQCFRHATDEAIKERSNYTNEQKEFLIDFGLTIIKVIHVLIQ